MIAIRRGDRAIFLYGFSKSERSNIGTVELEEFRRLARGFLSLDARQIAALLAEKEMTEIFDGG